jgi:hypothetical protein
MKKEVSNTVTEWEIKDCVGVIKIIDKNGKKNKDGKRLNVANVFYEEAWQDNFVSGLGRKQSEVRRTKKEAEANAKLIKSAPDLLGSLNLLVITLEEHFKRSGKIVMPSQIELAYLNALNQIKKATK